MAGDIIKIEGLVQLQAKLKAMDGESQKEIRVLFNEVAEYVAVGARQRAPVRTGNLRASIRVLSQQRRAIVAGGSAKVPYFGFIDYGNVTRGGRGKVGPGDSQRRALIPRGRILYAAFDARRAAVQQMLDSKFSAFLRRKGL